MLSIHFIRQNKEAVLEGLKKKNFKDLGLVEDILRLDEQRRLVQQENDALAAQNNAAAKSIGRLMAQGKKEEAEAVKKSVAENKSKAKTLSDNLTTLEQKQYDALVQLPNLPHASVPAGTKAEDNEVVKEVPTDYKSLAQLLPHWELTTKFDLIDFELGTKITGSGFPVYKGQGARLQRALINYFLEHNTAAGYQEMQPPLMVNEDSAFGTGQLPDKEGQMYHATQDNFYLIPTSEVPLTNIFRDEILTEEQIPMRLTAYTPCFRREAGSYGKDVRGLNRLHQFDKVEIVQLTKPEASYKTLEEMVDHVETLLKNLGLHYRLLRLCGGDMSFASALTYDFEVYSKAQERWLEVSSVSNFETFQTNRMKIRFRDEAGKTQLMHSLNGSSLALPRIVAALLEQYQADAHIELPKVLHPYFGTEKIQL